MDNEQKPSNVSNALNDEVEARDLSDTQHTLNDEIRAQELEQKSDEASDDEDEAKPKKIAKILKIIISILLYATIIVLIANFCGADHKELKNLYVTEGFMSAYENSTDFRTHAAGTEMSENGAIYAFSFVYNEQNGYMQLTVRYNKRHIDGVVKAISENAGKEYTLDDIGIYYTITDSNGSIYEPSVLGKVEWRNYVYFKLELKNVDFSSDSLTVNMMLENVKQVETENGKSTLVYSEGESTNAGSTLTFHEKDDTYIAYKFTRKEKKEIEKSR